MGGEEGPGRLTPKGRATRERIVEAAAGLMFRQGVAGTSIDDVRKATGVSGSQMTHYFRDKRSLVRAVIAWQADSVIGQHQHPALGKLDTFEALDIWAELNIARQRELHCEGGCSFGALAGELAGGDAETRSDLAAGFARWEALFREGLQAMRDRGDLRPDADPGQLAAGLLASLQGGMLLAKTTREIRHVEAALKSALEHVRSFASSAPPGAESSRAATVGAALSPGRSSRVSPSATRSSRAGVPLTGPRLRGTSTTGFSGRLRRGCPEHTEYPSSSQPEGPNCSTLMRAAGTSNSRTRAAAWSQKADEPHT